MNFFDDLSVSYVSQKISHGDGGLHVSGYDWGIGLIQGDGVVCFYDRHSSQKIKPPFLYLTFPRQAVGWRIAEGTVRDNRWFKIGGVRGERMVSSLLEYCTRERPFIKLAKCQGLVLVHQKMLELFRCCTPANRYKLSLCAENFAGAVYDSLNAPRNNSPIFRKIERIVEMICSDPAADCNIAHLASECGISAGHFRRLFLRYTGSRVHEFLLRKRFEKGIGLLQYSTASIKEISEQCGFARQADFARFIRKMTGMIPSDFRK